MCYKKKCRVLKNMNTYNRKRIIFVITNNYNRIISDIRSYYLFQSGNNIWTLNKYKYQRTLKKNDNLKLVYLHFLKSLSNKLLKYVWQWFEEFPCQFFFFLKNHFQNFEKSLQVICRQLIHKWFLLKLFLCYIMHY